MTIGSISSIVQLGYRTSLGLVVTMGYGQSAEPPPLVEDTRRYGPALTPSERVKWFGASYESPVLREAKRRILEKVKRQALGILPADEVEELLEIKIIDKVQAIAAETPSLQIDKPKVDIKALSARVAREVAADMVRAIREREQFEEEEDAIAIFLLH